MARLIADGEIRAVWVPGEAGIADPTAPSAAAISAGTNMTPELASLDTPLDGEATAAADLSSGFNKTVAGTYGAEVTIEGYRDDTNDILYPLFPRGTRGFIVVRRFGGSDVAIAAADVVDVFGPLRVVSRSNTTLDRGSVQMFTTQFAVGAEPTEDVAVVA
jgi:hypothetical protein